MRRLGVIWLIIGGAACAAQSAALPPPVVEPTPIEEAGPESYAAVQEFFIRKREQVFACYSATLGNASKKQPVQVQLALAVQPTGQAENVRIAETTLASRPLEDCIVAAVSRWQFPAPTQRIEVTYTYELNPK